MKKVLIRNLARTSLVGSVATLLAMGCTNASYQVPSPQDLQADIQALIDTTMAAAPEGAPIHSAVVQVTSLKNQQQVTLAAGIADPQTQSIATADSPFHIASITKPMTAIIILRMAERGEFGPDGIDTPLHALDILPKDVIDRLHQIDGRSYGKEITLRQLLSHTHGMRDILIDGPDAVSTGEPVPGSLVSMIFASLPEHMECLAADTCDIGKLPTARTWIPYSSSEEGNGILNFYLDNDFGSNALFPPGQDFHYSDTGYILLALTAEKIAEAEFAEILQREVFEPAGMNNAWFFPTTDPKDVPDSVPVMDVYAGELPMMTTGISLSFDWGGGGVVATADDLTAFASALIGGHLLMTEQYRKDMFEWTSQSRYGDPLENAYGLGVGYRHSSAFHLVGHSGAWGGFMSCDRAHELCVTGTINQAYATQNNLVDAIFDLFSETETAD